MDLFKTDSFRELRIPHFLQYLLLVLIPSKQTALSKRTTLNIDSAGSSGSQAKLSHFFYLVTPLLEAAL
jgi:hypothetical protein